MEIAVLVLAALLAILLCFVLVTLWKFFRQQRQKEKKDEEHPPKRISRHVSHKISILQPIPEIHVEAHSPQPSPPDRELPFGDGRISVHGQRSSLVKIPTVDDHEIGVTGERDWSSYGRTRQRSSSKNKRLIKSNTIDDAGTHLPNSSLKYNRQWKSEASLLQREKKDLQKKNDIIRKKSEEEQNFLLNRIDVSTMARSKSDLCLPFSSHSKNATNPTGALGEGLSHRPLSPTPSIRSIQSMQSVRSDQSFRTNGRSRSSTLQSSGSDAESVDSLFGSNFSIDQKLSLQRSESYRKTGKINFSAHYSTENESLEICIKRATNLAKGLKEVEVNPYVRLHLHPGKKQNQTNKQSGTREPFFNESFLFKNLAVGSLAQYKLHFEVFNHQGFIKGQRSLGKASIALSSLQHNRNQQFNIDLIKHFGRENIPSLLLSLNYNYKDDKLEVIIQEAKNLPKPRKNGVPNPYVTLRLFSENFDKTKETHRLENSRNPKFCESIYFQLPEDHRQTFLRGYTLIATVKDHCRPRDDQIIGHVVVSSTSRTKNGREQWDRIQEVRELFDNQLHILTDL